MGFASVIGKVAGAGAKAAKAGGKVAGAGIRAGAPTLKKTINDTLANMKWAKGSGFEGPAPDFFNKSAEAPKTGFEGTTPAFFNDSAKAVKQKTTGTPLSAVFKSVDEVASSITNIRSATSQVESGVLLDNEGNPAESLQPINEAVDKADGTVDQLRKVASAPLIESNQIEQIAQAATGLNRSVGLEQKAQAKQAEAQTLASEKGKVVSEPMATPVGDDSLNNEALEPAEDALSEFSRALEDLTEQIKSKGGGADDQGESWIDKIKSAVGWVRNTGGLAKDAAGLAKSKALQPVAKLGSKMGSFFGKLFGSSGAKLTGSVGERVIQLLESKAGTILGKSIAGAGLVLGSISAVEHAAKGDWVGVGLDAAVIGGSSAELTGVGAGPGAAVAAISAVTGAVRDGYADIFGIPPEQDPSFKDNMNMATQLAVNWVKSKLGMETKKQQAKSAQQIQAAAPSIAAIKPSGGGGAGTGISPASPTPPPAPAAAPAAAAPPPAPTPNAAATSKPAPGSGKQLNAPKEHGSASASATAPTPNAAASITPSTSGSSIAITSTAIESMFSQTSDTSMDAINAMMGRPQQRSPGFSGRDRTGTSVTHSPFFVMDMDTARDFYFDTMEMGR